MRARLLARPDRAFLLWAAVFFVFHQIGSVLPSHDLGAAIDVATPFLVAGATLVLLHGLEASGRMQVLALFAGVLYVHGHGVHLAANNIANAGLDDSVVYFWDERFSHIEAVIGWYALVAIFARAERERPQTTRGASPVLLAVAALVLGWTFFTGAVEGQTWWLELPVAAAFVLAALRAGGGHPLLRAGAGAFAVGALLIAGWALMHGGVPEFSAL